jgi:hypothetical protein
VIGAKKVLRAEACENQRRIILEYRNVSQIETRWSDKGKDTKYIAGKMGTWQGKKRCKGNRLRWGETTHGHYFIPAFFGREISSV